MPTFLILHSTNNGTVENTTEREVGFFKPTFYQISDSELQEYNAMNAHAKAAFIAEKLEAQIGTPTQDKKKVAPIVEVVERVEESVSVEMPEIEVEEPLNEPINEVKVVEKPKAKGRPKKTN